MTAERLSELQNLALAGSSPKETLTKEEQQAWDRILVRMESYKEQIRKAFMMEDTTWKK